jgi:hypothetical protein
MYGNDTHLLETRRCILQHYSVDVDMVTDLSALKEITLEREVDLLMLCHSLSYDECDAALTVARERQPQMKHMILTSNDSACAATPADMVVDTHDGPGKWVASVGQLLYGDPSPMLAT